MTAAEQFIANREADIELREPSLDIMGLLRRRRFIIAGVALIIIVLGIMVTASQHKKYQASTKLIVTTREGGAGTGEMGDAGGVLDVLSGIKGGRNTQTQAEIITNPDLLQAALFKLTPPERLKAFHRLPDPNEPPSWAYDVRAKQDTDVININTIAYDPKLAAKFANAIANEYLTEDLERNNKATSQARDYVQKQLGNSKTLLAKASNDLADYAKKTGLVSQEDQISAVAQSQQELQVELAASQSEQDAAAKRLNYLNQALSKTPEQINFASEMGQNPEYLSVQQQVNTLEGQLTEASAEFQPDSQTITHLKEQLDAQKKHLSEIGKDVLANTTREANPVRLKLIDDYADAYGSQLAADSHSRALTDQLNKVNGRIAQLPDQERELAALQSKVEVLNRTFNLLSDRYYSLLIEENGNIANGFVAGAARPPLEPSSPKIFLNMILTLVFAVIAGFVVAYLIEKADTKIRLPEDAENLSGLTALGFIPESQSRGREVVIGQAQPLQAFSESFRILRSNLNYVRLDEKPRMIAVTSAAPSEGKSTVALNLAIVQAMNGLKVILVDVDLRRPNVHKLLELSSAVGLTSTAEGSTTLQQAIIKTEFQNLDCLTAGPLPPNPADFLGTDKVRHLFDDLSRLYDVIILDSPPSSGLSDMQVIGQIADSVLVVVSLDTTKKPVFQAAIRMLRLSNAPLVGLIVNRMKKQGSGYYYGHYSYYQSYTTYGDEEQPKKEVTRT